MKLEFSERIFEKYSDIKFYENPSIASRVVLCGQTDRLTDRNEEANRRFSQLCLDILPSCEHIYAARTLGNPEP
jgi:hypothetical protein